MVWVQRQENTSLLYLPHHLMAFHHLNMSIWGLQFLSCQPKTWHTQRAVEDSRGVDSCIARGVTFALRAIPAIFREIFSRPSTCTSTFRSTSAFTYLIYMLFWELDCKLYVWSLSMFSAELKSLVTELKISLPFYCKAHLK